MTQVAHLAVATVRGDYITEREDVRRILVAQGAVGCTQRVLTA